MNVLKNPGITKELYTVKENFSSKLALKDTLDLKTI